MIRILDLYFFMCSGLVALMFFFAGRNTAYENYIDEVLLSSGFLALLYYFLKNTFHLSRLTLILGGYILLRIVLVSFFAVINGYSIANYLLPIKNWLILFCFFVIGQSVSLPLSRVYKSIFVVFILTLVTYILFEIFFIMSGIDFDALYLKNSRIPLIAYRIPFDSFLVSLVFMFLTRWYLEKKISTHKYFFGLLLYACAFLIAQTKQILFATFIIALYFLWKEYRPLLTRRYLLYVFLVLIITSAIALGLYATYTINIEDTYFSLVRRAMLLEYIIEKVQAYPLFGYPIPSNAFTGRIPEDIQHYFFDIAFETTIFPSDLPFLFIIAEEGIVGLLFVGIFLFFAWKSNPEARYIILVLIALIATFRMYYLIPLGSSFTYFLLGLTTRKRTD